jgi:hypothetical protein
MVTIFCNKYLLYLLQNNKLMVMQSTEKIIIGKVLKTRKGTLFFPEDFTLDGSSEAVRLALHRLEKKKIIKRIAQGIYTRPITSKYVGEVLPTAETVAKAIAKRDRIRIVPTGAYALNALGLSTQMPMKLVFLTDGVQREVKIGKQMIKFKRTTPKNLLAKGAISSLVLQALRSIGITKVSSVEEKKIIELLKKEKAIHLKHDIQLAPVWIKKIMQKAQ